MRWIRPLRLCLATALTVALAACNATFARKDTLGYAAGDAVAWNKAVHTIDPWPAASADTTRPVSGRRVARAIEAYEAGDAPPPAGQVLLAPMAPVAPLAP